MNKVFCPVATFPSACSGWFLSGNGPFEERPFMHDPERTKCRNADPQDGRSGMILFTLLFASSLISAAMILASAHLTVLAHPR